MAQTEFNSLATVVAAVSVIATPIVAQEHVCPGGTVIVQGGGERSEAICEAAVEAKGQLASCNLPVTQTVTVEITPVLPGNCHALYDCDNNLIQLLPLDAYTDFLSEQPESPWGHLESEVFFNSILRHELVHAALDDMPCPYEVCPVTQEFAAYNMQIRFLPEAERAPFERFSVETERPISRDSLNALVLAMSPETFVRNAHVYLARQDNPCELMADIASGEVLFDMPLQ